MVMENDTACLFAKSSIYTRVTQTFTNICKLGDDRATHYRYTRLNAHYSRQRMNFDATFISRAIARPLSFIIVWPLVR